MSTEERLAWAEKRFARLERRSRALTGLVVLLGCGLGLTWFMAADPPGLPVRGEVHSEQVDLSKLPAQSTEDVPVQERIRVRQLLIVDDKDRARIVLDITGQLAGIGVVNEQPGDAAIVSVGSKDKHAYIAAKNDTCTIYSSDDSSDEP